MTVFGSSDLANDDKPRALGPEAAALGMLLSRRSVGLLRDPAPDAGELAGIFEAGVRAPDHGRLRPWRFVIIRGEARHAFAEVLVRALRRRDSAAPAAMADRIRARLLGVPLVIAIGAKIRTESPIPEIEQLLSTGAAAMNMLNAIHALGYGGMWVTGANTYDRGVNDALGFAWPDRLVGMLFVGTPRDPARDVSRLSSADHVREWHGSEDGRRSAAFGPG